MFKIKNCVCDVERVLMSNTDSIYFYKESRIVKYSIERNIELIRSGKDMVCYALHQIDENYLIAVNDHEIIYLDSNLVIKERIPFKGGIGDFEITACGKLIVGIEYDFDLFLPTSGVYDIANQKHLWQGEKGSQLKILNNNIYSISNSNIALLDKNNGSSIWNYEFEKVSILPTLHYSDGEFVLIGFGAIDKLIYLNGVSGKVIWEKNTFDKGVLVDELKNTIHRIMVGYVNYNLNTGELVKKNVDRNYFSQVGIESQRSDFILIDNLLVTTDRKSGVLGVFDTIQLKFSWIYKIDKGFFPASKKIRWNDPYLILEDSKNNVHIFKKQFE